MEFVEAQVVKPSQRVQDTVVVVVTDHVSGTKSTVELHSRSRFQRFSYSTKEDSKGEERTEMNLSDVLHEYLSKGYRVVDSKYSATETYWKQRIILGRYDELN